MGDNVLVGKEVIVLQEMEAKRVGNGIRELRQRRGLSLAEFARIANIPDDYLIRLEQGNELKIKKESWRIFGKPVESLNRRDACRIESQGPDYDPYRGVASGQPPLYPPSFDLIGRGNLF